MVESQPLLLPFKRNPFGLGRLALFCKTSHCVLWPQLCCLQNGAAMKVKFLFAILLLGRAWEAIEDYINLA